MKIEWKTCFKVGISVLAVYFCICYFDVFRGFLIKAIGAIMPLLIGCVIAYVVNILMTFYEKHFFAYSTKKALIKLRRPICLVLASLSLVGIIVLVVSLILPQLLSCVQLILDQIPDAFDIFVEKLEKIGFVPEKLIDELSKMDWREGIGDLMEMLTSYFGNMVNVVFTVITSVFSWIVSTLLSVIFALYLLMSKDKLSRQANEIIDSYLSPKACKKIRYITNVLNDSFHMYIVGQSTEAVILGVLCTIGMMILSLPYATMIGALVAFTALIPVVGAYVGAIVGGFMIAMVSPMDALVFLIFIIVLQQIENNLIYPRVVGTSIGLPGMWVLAAVTVGGGVFGVVGMLLGVPLMAALYRIVRHDVRKKIVSTKSDKNIADNTKASVETENAKKQLIYKSKNVKKNKENVEILEKDGEK